MFTAAYHGKGADNGIGVVVKTIARRATLSKNILLSTAKDSYEFSRVQQLKTERKSNNNSPRIHVFFLETEEVDKARKNILKARSGKLQKSGETNIFLNI